MTKSATATLAEVVSSIEKQRTKIAALRTALDAQFTWINEMQAELDGVLRKARARSEALSPELPLHSGNGNGNGDHRGDE